MKLLTLFLAAVTIGSFAGGAAADSKDIKNRVAQLNAYSIKLVGVSLNALRYLADDPNAYHHLGHLEQSGGMKLIRELESKGYVKTQVIRALPDGTQQHETFLRVTPVGAGIEVRRSILNLQHNSALQPTR